MDKDKDKAKLIAELREKIIAAASLSEDGIAESHLIMSVPDLANRYTDQVIRGNLKGELFSRSGFVPPYADQYGVNNLKRLLNTNWYPSKPGHPLKLLGNLADG